MAKVITFSRVFPSYHLKAGQPTHFVEQMMNSLGIDYWDWPYINKLYELNAKAISDGRLTKKQLYRFWMSELNYKIKSKKHHTIRAGQRFAEGELFSPRVWSGKPYASPQIILWDDIEINSLWGFEATKDDYLLNGTDIVGNRPLVDKLAGNDGLNWKDLFSWFNKPFAGQVICWSKDISY